jgi:PAP2 superfamily
MYKKITSLGSYNFWLHGSKIVLGFTSLLLSITACDNSKGTDPEPETIVSSKLTKEYDTNVALKWADQTLKLIRTTPGFSPPVASRAIGYAGLTMYEAGVPGMPEYNSLVGKLSGLSALPKASGSLKYNWALVINAGQSQILKSLFANTSATNKTRVDSLQAAIQKTVLASTPDDTLIVKRSNELGVALAKAIFEYSKTDGGHEGYTRNFPATYIVPKGMCYWEPTENNLKIPMQPYWGSNRTFIQKNAGIALPVPKEASFNENSAFFKEYLTVYQKNKTLTQAEKEIAVWWADDPSETFTPPGHSYNIAKIAITTSSSKLDKAVEAFAKTGLAVSDAFVLCWKTKYTFMNVRPYNYVREAIDPTWIPFWPAPPFPGFSSGHSTQSAAAAIALTSIYGDTFSFVDNSWEGRPNDTKRNVAFKARAMSSFWSAAEESAMSRFYGGIHTKMDNDLGLSHGKIIGQNVAELAFKK